MCSGPTIRGGGRTPDGQSTTRLIRDKTMENQKHLNPPKAVIPSGGGGFNLLDKMREVQNIIQQTQRETGPLHGLALPDTKAVGVPDLKNLVTTRIRRP